MLKISSWLVNRLQWVSWLPAQKVLISRAFPRWLCTKLNLSAWERERKRKREFVLCAWLTFRHGGGDGGKLVLDQIEELGEERKRMSDWEELQEYEFVSASACEWQLPVACVRAEENETKLKIKLKLKMKEKKEKCCTCLHIGIQRDLAHWKLGGV